MTSTTSPRARSVGGGERWSDWSVRPYLRLFLAGLRQETAYLGAAAGGVVANVTFGFLKAAILLATVEAAGGSVAGYDQGQMLAFIWLGQSMLGLVNLMGRDVLGDRIKNGDIAIDFLRPLDLQAAGLATELGRRMFSLLPRTVPTLLTGALVTGMTLPGHLTPYLLGALSLVLGMSLAYLLVYLINIAGLWLVEVRGLQVAYMVVGGFFSGLYLPLALFPGWLQAVAYATPFPSILMTPIDVFSGRVGDSASLVLIAQQVGWLALAWLAGALLTRAGRRHLEVQGG